MVRNRVHRDLREEWRHTVVSELFQGLQGQVKSSTRNQQKVIGRGLNHLRASTIGVHLPMPIGRADDLRAIAGLPMAVSSLNNLLPVTGHPVARRGFNDADERRLCVTA